MNLTKAHAAALSAQTKGAITQNAFYRMKGKDIFRAAHVMQQGDYVSIRLQILEGWDKSTDTPEWVTLNKEGSLPSGTKPCFAFRAADLEYTPKSGECVVLLEGDDESGYAGYPAHVKSVSRGKIHLSVWDDEAAEDQLIKAQPNDVLILVGYAKDYAVSQQLFNILTGKQGKQLGLSVEEVQEVDDLLAAYDLDLNDWAEYTVAENPHRTALYKHYVKPNDLDEDGVIWSMFENGEKKYKAYKKKHLTVAEDTDFEQVIHSAKTAKLKEVYAKVVEKAKVDEDDVQTSVKGIRQHLIELCDTVKKQSFVVNFLAQ